MTNIYKFNDMAEDYSKYRPTYANECINYLQQQLRLDCKSTIADIGSGTGKLTKLLLDKGFKVNAVEPNDDMREISEIELGSLPAFKSIKGTAENTTLPDLSIDLITVGQAFHWFNIKRFLLECQRILKEMGSVAILYNNGDYTCELINRISDLSKKYCPMYKGPSGGIENNSQSFTDFFEFFDMLIFENNYKLTLEQFIGLNFSASYAPKKEDPNYQIYLNELIKIFEMYSEKGIITMQNNTILRLGKVKRK